MLLLAFQHPQRTKRKRQSTGNSQARVRPFFYSANDIGGEGTHPIGDFIHDAIGMCSEFADRTSTIECAPTSYALIGCTYLVSTNPQALQLHAW